MKVAYQWSNDYEFLVGCILNGTTIYGRWLNGSNTSFGDINSGFGYARMLKNGKDVLEFIYRCKEYKLEFIRPAQVIQRTQNESSIYICRECVSDDKDEVLPCTVNVSVTDMEPTQCVMCSDHRCEWHKIEIKGE